MWGMATLLVVSAKNLFPGGGNLIGVTGHSQSVHGIAGTVVSAIGVLGQFIEAIKVFQPGLVHFFKQTSLNRLLRRSLGSQENIDLCNINLVDQLGKAVSVPVPDPARS